MGLSYKSNHPSGACHIGTLVLGVSLLVATNLSQAQKADRGRLNPERRHWVEQTLKQLSLQEKIGQMLQIRVYADYPDSNDSAFRVVRDQIEKYHVGSVDWALGCPAPIL